MKLLLFLLCLLELLFATFFILPLGPYVTSLLLLSISLGIAILYLKIATQPTLPGQQNSNRIPPLAITILQWALFGTLTYFTFAELKFLWWYELTYPNPGHGGSDIIPQITALVQRFLHGEQPYYPIKFSEYDLYPTYLPLQWLPYIPLELVQKDYRWVPTFAMWFACAYFFITHRKHYNNSIWAVIIPVWPLVIWFSFIWHDNLAFVYCVEGLIASYYFFTAESIKKQNVAFLAITVSVCLLSRYSIIFWVPLCLALHFVAGKRREALIIAGTALIFFITIYWFPFLRKDGNIFINGYNYHTSAALQEWLHDLAKNNGTANLYNGLGLTPYALKFLPGNEASVLSIYKVVHFAACAECVVILGLIFVRNRSKYPLHVFLLFSFKVYLTIFYMFIQIPYKYLFLVPFFTSACLLGAAFSHTHVKEKQTFAS